ADITRLSRSLTSHLRAAAPLALVREVRVLGGIGVVETHRPVNMAKIQAFFVGQGVWIRPFGTRIYLMPPYITTDAEIAQLGAAIVAACQCDEFFQL
ncbi:MAG: aminotransferase class III-fold pyridoxal phosphate-dependent enzyme, partial [Bacteroidota bacterium]